MKNNLIQKLLKISRFPDPNSVPDDIVSFGGDLEIETLLDAYLHGIFPWPHEGYPLLWFSPQERGILEFKDLHVGRTLQKLLKKNKYTFKINTNFKEVVEYCSKVPRKGQKGTWINAEIKKAYQDLFNEGHVLCVECYLNEKLVGGLYGVFVAGVFGGESMFGLEDNVSKLCVIKAVEHLKVQGLTWLDIQMVTPVLESLGGKYISRNLFLEKLKKSQIPALKLRGVYQKGI